MNERTCTSATRSRSQIAAKAPHALVVERLRISHSLLERRCARARSPRARGLAQHPVVAVAGQREAAAAGRQRAGRGRDWSPASRPRPRAGRTGSSPAVSLRATLEHLRHGGAQRREPVFPAVLRRSLERRRARRRTSRRRRGSRARLPRRAARNRLRPSRLVRSSASRRTYRQHPLAGVCRRPAPLGVAGDQGRAICLELATSPAETARGRRPARPWPRLGASARLSGGRRASRSQPRFPCASSTTSPSAQSQPTAMRRRLAATLGVREHGDAGRPLGAPPSSARDAFVGARVVDQQHAVRARALQPARCRAQRPRPVEAVLDRDDHRHRLVRPRTRVGTTLPAGPARALASGAQSGAPRARASVVRDARLNRLGSSELALARAIPSSPSRRACLSRAACSASSSSAARELWPHTVRPAGSTSPCSSSHGRSDPLA